ncbi:MAG: HigA family addiction module antidote protein [Xanthomonadales bacterium]|nr:HigA family addiction module antidote protein [Gammaproteobacteria bacterium]NNJ64757.1 HigA family addiction module antidote protein [Xanthomonadales bacterium]
MAVRLQGSFSIPGAHCPGRVPRRIRNNSARHCQNFSRNVVNQLMVAAPGARKGCVLTSVYLEPFGLSARALAEKLAVSPSTLNRVITGKSGISPEMALRLSKILGRSTTGNIDRGSLKLDGDNSIHQFIQIVRRLKSYQR